LVFLKKRVMIPHMDPHIAAKGPVQVELEAGKDYWYCTCGHSLSQPFCDGAHKGKGISPMKFAADKTGPAWLCQCKRSGTPPFCDGAHKAIP